MQRYRASNELGKKSQIEYTAGDDNESDNDTDPSGLNQFISQKVNSEKKLIKTPNPYGSIEYGENEINSAIDFNYEQTNFKENTLHQFIEEE